MNMTWESCSAQFSHFGGRSESIESTIASLSTNQMSPLFSSAMNSPSFSINSIYASCGPSHSVPPQQNEEQKQESRKMRLRRYKTPSPQLLRSRRNAANERERRRMLMLNIAYEKLRTVLPEMDSGRRLSKYETLLMAQQYIEGLSKILRSPPQKIA